MSPARFLKVRQAHPGAFHENFDSDNVGVDNRTDMSAQRPRHILAVSESWDEPRQVFPYYFFVDLVRILAVPLETEGFESIYLGINTCIMMSLDKNRALFINGNRAWCVEFGLFVQVKKWMFIE